MYFHSSCEHYDLRGDLNRWCGPTIVVNFDKVNKRLQIYSTQQEVVRRASLLDASFMRVLRQKKLIHMQKDELTRRLNDTIKNQYVSRLYSFIYPYRICKTRYNLKYIYIYIQPIFDIDLQQEVLYRSQYCRCHLLGCACAVQ